MGASGGRGEVLRGDDAAGIDLGSSSVERISSEHGDRPRPARRRAATLSRSEAVAPRQWSRTRRPPSGVSVLAQRLDERHQRGGEAGWSDRPAKCP